MDDHLAQSLVGVLVGAGFEPIGELRFRLRLGVHWRASDRILLLCVSAGGQTLLKGVKAYHLLAIEDEARTWMRDINALHDYLQAHVSDLHLSFSWYRDVPRRLAERHADAALGRSAGDVRATEDRIRALRERIRGAQHAAQHIGIQDTLLEGHLQGQIGSLRDDLERTEEAAGEQRDLRDRREMLIEGLLRKGSAARLTFSISSATHVVGSPDECADVVAHIGKELADYHKYQITQRLSGSRLRLRFTEATEPEMTWLELWFGGSIDDRKLEQILCPPENSSLQVYADDDLRISQLITEPAARIAPRVLGSLLERLDPPRGTGSRVTAPRASEALVTLGRLADSAERACIDLSAAGQGLITGTTGSGKSVCLRVLAEEAAAHDGISILVLDPRNQWVGILLPEDRPEWTAAIDNWGGLRPRSFPFQYHAPGNAILGAELPDPDSLAEGRHVVSLAGLDDNGRCDRAAEVLDACFDRHARGEAPCVRQLVLIEEAQLFTRRRISEHARKASERVERSIERIYREGRKYGIRIWCASQTLRDFAHTLAGVRQNATTKCLLHNTDREIDLARDMLDNPRVLTKLGPGEAMICNPVWGAMHVRIRPPVSKIWEFDERETAELIRRLATAPDQSVSSEADRLFRVIGAEIAQRGRAVNVTEVGRAAGLTSRRKLVGLVDELEAAGRISTHRLPERGKPRMVELRVTSTGPFNAKPCNVNMPDETDGRADEEDRQADATHQLGSETAVPPPSVDAVRGQNGVAPDNSDQRPPTPTRPPRHPRSQTRADLL